MSGRDAAQIKSPSPLPRVLFTELKNNEFNRFSHRTPNDRLLHTRLSLRSCPVGTDPTVINTPVFSTHITRAIHTLCRKRRTRFLSRPMSAFSPVPREPNGDRPVCTGPSTSGSSPGPPQHDDWNPDLCRVLFITGNGRTGRTRSA